MQNLNYTKIECNINIQIVYQSICNSVLAKIIVELVSLLDKVKWGMARERIRAALENMSKKVQRKNHMIDVEAQSQIVKY